VTTSAPVTPVTTAAISPATTLPATPVTTAAAVQTTLPAVIPAVTTAQPIAVTTAAPVIATTAAPAVTTAAPVIVTTAAPVIVTPKAATTAAPAFPLVTEPLPTQPVITVTPPEGYAFGAYDQLCAVTSTFELNQCTENTQSATDLATGHLYCDRHEGDCCVCESIVCEQGCNQVRFGDRGAFGVKDVRISGAPGPGAIGASLVCHGTESCRNAQIVASAVDSVNCFGYRSCNGAVMVITDPKPNFVLDCTGYAACEDLEIQIVYSGPPPGYMCAVDQDPALEKPLLPIGSIECENEEACQGMRLTVNNAGCSSVRIGALRCSERDSCNLADFDLIGDVSIDQCHCGPSCADATGLSACFQNLAKVECNDPQSCLGQQRVITNPLNNFAMFCGNEESCKDSSVTFEFTAEPNKPRAIERMNGLVFGGKSAGENGLFVFNNAQGLAEPAFEGATPEPVWLTVNKIECGQDSACENAVFVVGDNVSIREFQCALDACYGCLVKHKMSDAGVPCDPEFFTRPVIMTPAPTVPVTPAPIVTPAPVVPLFPASTMPVVPATTVLVRPAVPAPPANPQTTVNGQFVPI